MIITSIIIVAVVVIAIIWIVGCFRHHGRFSSCNGCPYCGGGERTSCGHYGKKDAECPEHEQNKTN